MLTASQSERLTRTDPGTPMGEALRRYWLPALLSDELKENDGPPVRVRILGEDLVAFRDSGGSANLVSAYCPHRRAPLFFGRNEENGLRCVYHGWKFDGSGACVDMPSEPPDSLFKAKVRVEAYPTWEGGGMVWTYMGPAATAPPPPRYEFVNVPATHRVVSKTYEDCNYLQALEGGLDNTHSAILHNRGDGDVAFLRNYERIIPRIDVRTTGYGYAFSATRLVDDRQWVRVSQYFMPSTQLRGTLQQIRQDGRPPTMDGHIWVPIDDHTTWVYNFTYSYYPDVPLSAEYAVVLEAEQGRGPDEVTSDFRPVRNRGNDYLIDRNAQKHGSFTGITGVNTQDYALQENMGRIVDRTKEHLGTIDLPIIRVRQLLLDAAQDVGEGRSPRGADPVTHAVRAADCFVSADVDWQEALQEQMRTLYAVQET
jgi:phthalate 4,5-dioxygenase oxygenase subunit